MKKNNPFYISLVVILLMFFPPIVNNARGRAISGDIGLTYTDTEVESNSTVSTQSTLEQRYRLNYNKFIFSPNLVSYSLNGVFIQEEGDADGFPINTEAEDYFLSMSFIQKTRMPFVFSAYRNTSNSINHHQAGSPLVEQTMNGLRLSGLIIPRRLPTLKYWVLQNDKERTGAGETLDDRRRELRLETNKKWKNSSMAFSYNYKNTLDRLTDREESSHYFSLSGRSDHRISRVTKLGLRGSAKHNTSNDSTSIASVAMLRYKPSGKFSGLNTLSYSHDFVPETSNYSVKNATSANYSFSRKLKSSANVAFSTSDSSSGKTTTESAAGTLNYRTNLPKKVLLTANAAASYSANQGHSSDTSNYGSSVSTSLRRSFTAIRSHLGATANADYSRSSTGEAASGYQIHVNGSSNYIRRLNAKANFKYKVDDALDAASKAAIRADATLKYLIPMGFRARMDLYAGTIIERGLNQREFFNAGQSFRYALHRNLSLSAASSYWMEPSADSSSVSADVDINYRLRQIFVKVEYEWKFEDKREKTLRENMMKIEATRRF